MSGFEDDLTDSSFEGSSSSFQKDEPPTLDETLLDSNVFGLFMNYMKSQQSAGSLLFLKDARKFRLLNQPRPVIIQQATRIIMTYFTDASPLCVNASEDVKKKMIELAFDPAAELSLDKNTFSVAFGEIYNTVVPHFRNWISTEEWKEAVPFHRLPPPTFNIVLSSNALRVLFNKYLKSQIDRDSDGTAAHAFHLWKFCLIANDFRDGKYTHDSHLDTKKKKKKKGEAEGSDAASEKSKDEEGGDKKESPEEYAKRIYKKYKHQISLPYDKTMPHAVFIIRALDQAIEEFDKSALFARWIALKQFQGVDYQAKIVHQSLTPEGYAEPPTLAAALTSSILPTFLAILQGTEQGMNIEFLTNILTFHHKFSHFDADGSGTSGSSTGSQDSSTGSGKTRKDMQEEAKRIYTKFLQSGEMYCDPGLVEEIKTLVTKSGGKGVNPSMFRKAGAFIYHRSERTWCREARATFEWVNKSYDNRSKNSRGVEEEFSMKNLPEGFDLQIVPSLDDICSNEPLMKDYSAFVNKQTDNIFEKFAIPFYKYFRSPLRERKPILEKIVAVFTEAAGIYKELEPAAAVINKEVATRERVSDSILYSLLGASARAGANRFYKQWVVEHSMVWKTAAWTPVTAIKYGDLSLIMGMSAVESKIEEAALKGKSGLSRYLAKRAVKKQAISNVRNVSTTSTTSLKNQEKGNAVVDTNFVAASKEDDSGVKDVDVSDVARVPTLNEILTSAYLRKFFERGILDAALNPEQKKLWTAFCAFNRKYDFMLNEEVADAQEEMLKEILEICDTYKDLIPNSEEVKERAKKQKFLFPQFFRPEETACYGKLYAMFEAGIRKKGWK